MSGGNFPSGVRLDVDGRFLQAALRTSLLAIKLEIRRIRRELMLFDLLPPLGWVGKRSRLELAASSHATVAESLERHLERIEELGAAITPTPAEPTAGSAAPVGQPFREVSKTSVPNPTAEG